MQNDKETIREMLTAEKVNHPAHYNPNGIEVIDAIEDWNLDFYLGNAVKYIARAGKKDPKKASEDLHKAIWYLKRHLKTEYGEET